MGSAQVGVVLGAIECAPPVGDPDTGSRAARDYRVLIAWRGEGRHLAGHWELPGGKRRADETSRAALRRELGEELGLGVEPLADAFCGGSRGAGATRSEASPAARRRVQRFGGVTHAYPDRCVQLEAFRVSIGRCERLGLSARGAEGQWLAWVHPVELRWLRWPEANRRFADALQLPQVLAISPDPGERLDDWMAWWSSIEARVRSGGCGLPRQIQLRAPTLVARDRDAAYQAVVEGLQRLDWRGRLWLNPGADDVRSLAHTVARVSTARGVAWGWHLPEAVWRAAVDADDSRASPGGPPMAGTAPTGRGPRDEDRRGGHVLAALGADGRLAARPWMAATHDRDALRLVGALPVHERPAAVTLSPVCPTPTHPDARALGALGFARLARCSPVPVYALGGLSPTSVAVWRRLGAQGVAGIRGFW